MCSLTRKQLKSFDAIASCVRRQGSSLRVVMSMHHVFFDRGSSLKAVVSIYHVLGNKEAV